tara:strand:- start:1486 stop:2376 length:891 start_codon:yes stop_codon:yes gene_type:complete
MKYILFNYGEIPEYLDLTINSILTVDQNAEIVFISDKKLSSNVITNIDIRDYPDLISLKENLYDYFKDSNFSSIKYPVFFTSLLRVFSIAKIAEMENIQQFVHFDNDVIIYKSFDELSSTKVFDHKNTNITKITNNKLSFGYSFFPTIDSAKFLSDKSLNILENNEYYSNNFQFGTHLSEMKILGIINIKYEEFISILPSLPYRNEAGIIFDPSSYGQYFNGLHHRRGNYVIRKRWVSPTEIIGSEIKSKRIKVKIVDKKPFVEFDNTKIDIANLHVHSKNLKKFLPKHYKNYLSL